MSLQGTVRVAAFALFVGAVIAGLAIPFTWFTNLSRLAAWLILVGGVTAVVIAVAPGEPTLRGILTDERARYSQPALITLCWFVVIVSAYLACAEWNTALWKPDPHNPVPLWIKVPASLWVLAGIVGVDIVGTGIILLAKKRRTYVDGVASEARGALFIAGVPQIGDLIAYDEVGAQNRVDLGALQKLLLQIAAVIVYAAALGRLIYATDPSVAIAAFPAIPEEFLALLGIGTATALVNRSIPR